MKKIGLIQRITPSRRLAIGLVLTLLIIVVYGQVGDHGFVSYDDPTYITENDPVKEGLACKGLVWAFTATVQGHWHPLTWLSHMADCQLYGLDSRGHHRTNLLLHIVNTILLFMILERMSGATWKSAVVAALFALHPLHVESVAWVTGRKDLLSTFFMMLTIWTYILYVEKPGCRPLYPEPGAFRMWPSFQVHARDVAFCPFAS